MGGPNLTFHPHPTPISTGGELCASVATLGQQSISADALGAAPGQWETRWHTPGAPAALGTKIKASRNRFIASKRDPRESQQESKQLRSVADGNSWVTVLSDSTGRAVLNLACCFIGVGQSHPKEARC